MSYKNKCLAKFLPVLAVFGIFLPANAAELIGVRFGPDGNKTRIVLDLDGEPAYALAGDVSGTGRLIVDFAGLSVSTPNLKYRPGKGHIRRFGFAANSTGEMRGIFEFSRTAAISDAFLIPASTANPNYRLVIDLETASESEFLASLPPQYPDLGAVIEQVTATPNIEPNSDQTASSQPDAAALPTEKYTIVIDAGHGGRDPGAVGPNGTLEKTVTLAAAKLLREILNSRKRYTVVLIREKDKRIALEDREPLARKAGADLFISLHSDALANINVRGGSVYTLSDKGTERAIKVAKSEGNYRADNSTFESQEVANIVLDLSQSYTQNESSKFARILLEELSGKTPLLNRSHRTADLRVLLAPDVPTVLFEMAYISNAKDEANLTSKAWRKRTMTAVADAIDAYFDDRENSQISSNNAGGAQ